MSARASRASRGRACEQARKSSEAGSREGEVVVEVGSGEAGSEGSEEAGSEETGSEEVVVMEQGSGGEVDEKEVDVRKRGA